jgi:arginyl-tRNA synthetase
MFEKEQNEIQTQIESILENQGIYIQPFKWSWIPFSGHWGISTSFFSTASYEAKIQKVKNVRQLAIDIADQIASTLKLPSAFEKVEAVNGYLNIYYDSDVFAKRVIDEILDKGDMFGCGYPTGKKIMVEFSQPNTHKAFHVGHLRTMFLGSSICEILEFAGNDVVRANYIGDIGLHVIKWIWNYLNFHNEEVPPPEGKTQWMGGIYSEAVKKIDDNPEYETQVREYYKLWDEKDSEIVALWERTRKWSLEAIDEVYELLGIKFDKVYFESDLEKPGKEIVKQLNSLNLIWIDQYMS